MASIAGTTMHEVSNDRAWSGRMLQAWCEDLAGYLPSQRPLARRRHVRLAMSSGGVAAFVLRNRRTPALDSNISVAGDEPDWTDLRTQLRRGGLARLPVVIQLDPGRVLLKQLKLPAAVNSVLDAVLRNQMRRLSPWPEDDTIFAHRISATPDDEDHVNVEVAIAHRSMIVDLLERSRAAGIEPDAIVVAHDVDDREAIALYSAQIAAKVRSARQIKWLLSMLLVIAVAIGCLGIVQFYTAGVLRMNLEHAIEDAQQRISGHRRQLDRRGAIAQERARLIKRRHETPPAIWVLNTVTDAIPDDTWLRKLTIADGGIVLTGTSANTAALVPLLERTGKFKQVRFNGPTTRNPNGTNENFSISARIKFSGIGGGQR